MTPRLVNRAGFVLIVCGSVSLLWTRFIEPAPGVLYDLGRVHIAEGAGVADGAVELTGRPSGVRQIVSLVPSCACLKAQLPATGIGAGQTLVIPVPLSLSSIGEKRAFLTAVFEDGTHDIVHVKAVGVAGDLAAKPQLSNSVLTLGDGDTRSIVALVHQRRDHAPRVRWRLPPDVAMHSMAMRYLIPMQEKDPGVWEVTTKLTWHSIDARSLLGVAIMDIDEAQAASAIVVGEP